MGSSSYQAWKWPDLGLTRTREGEGVDPLLHLGPGEVHVHHQPQDGVGVVAHLDVDPLQGVLPLVDAHPLLGVVRGVGVAGESLGEVGEVGPLEGLPGPLRAEGRGQEVGAEGLRGEAAQGGVGAKNHLPQVGVYLEESCDFSEGVRDLRFRPGVVLHLLPPSPRPG